jgi:hypothetical protein
VTLIDESPVDDVPEHSHEPRKRLLYDSVQAAERLEGAVTPNWLRRQAAADAIPCVRLGRTIRWSEATLAQLVAENEYYPKRRTPSC